MDKKLAKKLDHIIHIKCKNGVCKDTIPVIVYIKKENKNKIKEKLQSHGCKINCEFDIIDAFSVDMCADKIEDLAKDARIKYIASDVKVNTSLDVAKKAIKGNEVPFTGKGIGIAVIDTGIYPHADFGEKNTRIIAFKDFVANQNAPYDDNGHGTHVSGIIAGNGKSSDGKYVGIAPESNLIGIKVMNEDGVGNVSDIVKAMDWILKNKEKYNIRIASLSLGVSPVSRNKFDPLVASVEKLWDSGIVVIAAAGNEGPLPETIDSPGISKKIITVGCSDDKNTPSISDDNIAEFSSRGPAATTKKKPDVVAPGVDIMSLSNKNNGYISQSGTSMSTPMITGSVALLLEKNPLLTPDEVKKKVLNATSSLGEPYTAQGKGIIDNKKLLS